MKLTQKQKNELLTRIRLATELKPSAENLKKFLVISAYQYSSDGRILELSKILNKDYVNLKIYFNLICYEIPKEYCNSWDIDYYIINKKEIKDIDDIKKLEDILNNYLNDTTKLLPEWHIDSILI